MNSLESKIDAIYRDYHEQTWALRASDVSDAIRSERELELWDAAEAALADVWIESHA